MLTSLVLQLFFLGFVFAAAGRLLHKVVLHGRGLRHINLADIGFAAELFSRGCFLLIKVA